jgi:hypothetical protein
MGAFAHGAGGADEAKPDEAEAGPVDRPDQRMAGEAHDAADEYENDDDRQTGPRRRELELRNPAPHVLPPYMRFRDGRRPCLPVFISTRAPFYSAAMARSVSRKSP